MDKTDVQRKAQEALDRFPDLLWELRGIMQMMNNMIEAGASEETEADLAIEQIDELVADHVNKMMARKEAL